MSFTIKPLCSLHILIETNNGDSTSAIITILNDSIRVNGGKCKCRLEVKMGLRVQSKCWLNIPKTNFCFLISHRLCLSFYINHTNYSFGFMLTIIFFISCIIVNGDILAMVKRRMIENVSLCLMLKLL